VCIAADALLPIHELKIKNIVTVPPANEPAKPVGSDTKWPLTPIIDKIRKTATDLGKYSTLTTGASIVITIHSTVSATACFKNNAMPNAAHNILQRWTR
jgi:hypothetical protein